MLEKIGDAMVETAPLSQSSGTRIQQGSRRAGEKQEPLRHFGLFVSNGDRYSAVAKKVTGGGGGVKCQATTVEVIGTPILTCLIRRRLVLINLAHLLIDHPPI